ncbi:4'-phosphopantetheinyl transferase family protein [Marinimicrobium sp. ARAG 43.8]|uniref:4'-phosphopantetheinyl transferase family protein n=1 Tax=Marinimicrobium sp. ARAG 43.8 TaxID=3418719 RepID=UPI003CF51E5E
MILLPNQSIHLWLIDYRTVDLDDQRDNFEQWLSDDEREKLARYSRPALRDQQLITRAGVRAALSEYSDSVQPVHWAFEISERGKPAVAGDGPIPELSFNLSHSGDWLALGVSVDLPIGVDLQRRDHNKPVTELAERFFSPEEAQTLLDLPAERQEAYFFQLWTLKEAYLKARGLGIAEGLDKACFDIDNNGLITASFDPVLNEAPDEWQFHYFELDDDYCLSVALKQPAAQDASPLIYKLVPGGPVSALERVGHQIQVR